MTEKLLSCPFCGGKPEFRRSGQRGHYIACTGCDAASTMFTAAKDDVRDLLIETWNRRPAPQSNLVGWLYDNEDTGREYSADHPVDSGEVPDATNVVPATAENLLAELKSSWKAWNEDREEISRLRDIPDGIELAARFVEKRLKDYVDEFGSTDPETGTVEFPGNGDEYVGELEEIIEGIRALKLEARA